MKRLTFALSLALVAMTALQAAPTMYVIGDVENSSWSPGSGLAMTYDQTSNCYKAHINISSSQTGVFIFADQLSPEYQDWVSFNANHRYGANKSAEINNFVVTRSNMSSLTVTKGSTDFTPAGFELPHNTGGYDLELNLTTMKLKVTGDYPTMLYMLGFNGNWDPTNAWSMTREKNGNFSFGIWEITEPVEFKLLSEPSENATVYGAAESTPLAIYQSKPIVAGSSVNIRMTPVKNAVLIVDKDLTTITLMGPGDLNNSGKIDGGDLNILINIMLGKESEYDYGSRADVNNDHTVDGNDINTLINLILGN